MRRRDGLHPPQRGRILLSCCELGVSARLSIEADILVVDPYKVTANGSPPKTCYVQSYMGYEQEDFQDMNRVTRRGTNWHNLQVNGQERSIGFSDGPHNCIAILKP